MTQEQFDKIIEEIYQKAKEEFNTADGSVIIPTFLLDLACVCKEIDSKLAGLTSTDDMSGKEEEG